jgi:hypothetical protein
MHMQAEMMAHKENERLAAIQLEGLVDWTDEQVGRFGQKGR